MSKKKENEIGMSKKENEVAYYCPKCGADDRDLQHDALVKWDVKKRAWEVESVLGVTYCGRCEEELNHVNVVILEEGDKLPETLRVVTAYRKISASRQHETEEERLFRILRAVDLYVQMGTSHLPHPSEVPELKEYYDTIHPDTKED